MIVKANNDEIIEVNKIIRDESAINGYVHSKKTPEFTLHFDDNDKAKEAMTLICVSLAKSTYLDINSINFQIKNS